jgi:signal transduction histidine kinase
VIPGGTVTSSIHPTLHGRNPREVEASAQEWLVRDPETMHLDGEGRIQWMCDIKRRRLGEAEATRLIGARCNDHPEVCLHSCEECALAKFRLGGESADRMSTWHVTRHTRQPLLVHLEAISGADDQPLTSICHIPHRLDEDDDVGERVSRQAMCAAMSAITMGLAHEMRNPLTALEMKLCALRQRPVYGLTEKGKEAVDDLLGVCGRLGGVIESLCAFSRPTPLRRQEIDPVKLIEHSLANRSETLQGIGVRVTSELRRSLIADPDQLGMVMDHLISNAADAMPDGGELTITLTSLDQWCCIDVTDTGVGFPASIRERFGQPFVTNKPAGLGSGLGLSLCQMILERHAGRLQLIDPGPGRTTVRAALPMQTTT